MNYQHLVLAIYWLWTANRSQSGTLSMYNDTQCYCTVSDEPTGDFKFDVIFVQINNPNECENSYICSSEITCDNQCSASIICNQCYTKATITGNLKIVTPTSSDNNYHELELTTDDVVTKKGFSTSNSSYSTVVAALGALVGLLLVLLVIVTTILIWTCQLLKRRGGMNFKEYHMR